MKGPYPDEAVSSWIIRASVRGLFEFEEVRCSPEADLDAAPDTLRQVGRLPDAAALLESLAAQGIRRRWPAADPRDLDELDPNRRALAKVCEACLAEDAVQGRDHYLRQEWRFSWRVSCSRHRTPLVDVETAELAPVRIDGVPGWRVRLLRDYDQRMDPFLARTGRGGGGRRVIMPAPLLCLEADIMASLAGKGFPCIWSCGHDWSRARGALRDLADLLLTPAKGSRERLIHRIHADEAMPQTHAREFSGGALNALAAVWQRRVVGALATLLLDPEHYEHARDGQHLKAHSELVYGTSGSRKLHGPLGRLASQDFLCVMLSGADVPTLKTIERQLERWPSDLRRRIRNAAAVALYRT